jgi:hypothetical protein
MGRNYKKSQLLGRLGAHLKVKYRSFRTECASLGRSEPLIPARGLALN